MSSPPDPDATGAYHPAPPAPPNGERFAPGDRIAGRYRIVAVLGKGGMGVVYRADDLTLGQSVALKFLPAGLARDPDRLARFHAEVRTARQISHPHVCRVHDVGEADGQPFLTMEYIDGEDLAALLRRIGRLPEEKGVELARQLCLGLAAAHDRGVIHRDLKPANVMIDARGQVRLTDFGLAAAGAVEDVRSGTPAYQAPEQLAGREVTARSDLFALGLVLYEMFTGRRPFPAATSAELRHLYAEGTPSRPSGHVSGLDPSVERAILRCLEREPADRPRSAYEVVAALPGGDPLAAALAAGQTPSPEAVANAPIEGTLHPLVAAALLAAILLGIYGVARLNDPSRLFRQVPLRRARPDELADKAREWIERLGYAEPPAGSARGFKEDRLALERLRRDADWSSRRRGLAGGRPAVLYFWYREGPGPLVNRSVRFLPGFFGLPGWVTPTDPPMTEPGMTAVALDLKGRLLEFHAVPARDDPGGAAPPPDWAALFGAAGLDMSRYRVDDRPRRTPPVYADARAAWDGPDPDHPADLLRVEAAACHGRPVYFSLGPAGEPDRFGQPPRQLPIGARVLIAVIITSIFTIGSVLASRNWRRGSANRAGAFRLAAYAFVLMELAWVVLATHAPSFSDEVDIFSGQLGFAVWGGAQVWIWYLALEPYVRRRWPWLMVGWNRLLAGRWRDPLVGRDLVLGGLLGTTTTLLLQVQSLLPDRMGLPPPMPMSTREDLLGQGVGLLVIGQLDALYGAMGQFFVLFVLVVLLRRPALALALAYAVHVLILLLEGVTADVLQAGGPLPLAVPIAMASAALIYLVLLRFGFLAHVVGLLFAALLSNGPLTTDLSAWYAGSGLVCALMLAGLAGYGFIASLGGRRLFGEEIPGEG